MSLDFAEVAAQALDLLPLLHRAEQQKREQLQVARRTRSGRMGGRDAGWEALRDRAEERRDLLRFTLPARLLDDPSTAVAAPSAPGSYTVLATDGSQIEPDRHAPAACYVINIGRVLLRYGDGPRASLSSTPVVYPQPGGQTAEDPAGVGAPEEDGDTGGHEEAPEMQRRTLLALHRSVEEIRALRDLIEQHPPDSFTLGLLDGSLILWNASAGREREKGEAYVRAYVDTLKEIRELARARSLALASFISLPNSREVLAALRASHCPDDAGYCASRCMQPHGPRPCDVFTLLRDRELFADLTDGARSAVFGSEPSIVVKHYLPEENHVRFFYLNTGTEIARVEVPAWVAADIDLLDAAHATVYDQCRRNFGYPVALMEAHEEAVVSDSEAAAFWRLMADTLVLSGLEPSESAKARSKRAAWA